MSREVSGQQPFVFEHCADLHALPGRALGRERDLHGGFAVDGRPEHGHIYYGMPGCGLLRVAPDLTEQEVIELPSDLRDVDFILWAPEFERYMAEETVFKPTDTALVGERLLVADGYGANFILEADLAGRRWAGLFGGKTESDEVHGKFGKAHGMNPTPDGGSRHRAGRSHPQRGLARDRRDPVPGLPELESRLLLRSCPIEILEYEEV